MATTNVAASRITALLGPTNTGKTHRAVERMLEHESGMIGLPLRLLAREVYDRVSARIGEAEVALVTGEEKRIGARARYFVCTVEAMPLARDVDFVAIDEIQLAAHPQRGHVFSERLLSARGVEETWLLGADTMRPLVERLVPTARFVSHPRLSKLSGRGSLTLGALPPRSAVVAFSTPRVYELAERIKRRRGGAAVVLGALSPRARNAQVAMFQAGEVDYMVATDAIGMGLNLDLDHVAFADLAKFDGKETRPLEPHELAQIAGRAGRHLNDGSFSTLAPLASLPERVQLGIEGHHFPPVRQLWWRSADLDTASIDALLDSLRAEPKQRCLRLIERADDFDALKALSHRSEIRERARSAEQVSLLWQVCQVPDYRQLLLDHHANLVGELFVQLTDRGRIDPDWLAEQIRRVDDTGGGIDTLLMRMEPVRTWAYVSAHAGWRDDAAHFQELTRTIEDRLSDAIHRALVERFVDGGRRSAAHRARARPRVRATAGAAESAPDSAHPFSKLLELRAQMIEPQSELSLDDEVEALVSAPHARFRVDAAGVIFDRENERAIAIMTRGADLLHPEVRVTDDELGSGARSRIQRRLVAWTRDAVSELLAPLRTPALRALEAPGRGLVYQLEQKLGALLTRSARSEIEAASEQDIEKLERAGVMIGRHLVYARPLVSSALFELKSALITAQHGSAPRLPPRGAVSFALPPGGGGDRERLLLLGFALLGPRAVRVDVAERIARAFASRELAPELGRVASWLGGSVKDAAAVLAALGVEPARNQRVRRRRRPRRRTAHGAKPSA